MKCVNDFEHDFEHVTSESVKNIWSLVRESKLIQYAYIAREKVSFAHFTGSNFIPSGSLVDFRTMSQKLWSIFYFLPFSILPTMINKISTYIHIWIQNSIFYSDMRIFFKALVKFAIFEFVCNFSKSRMHPKIKLHFYE